MRKGELDHSYKHLRIETAICLGYTPLIKSKIFSEWGKGVGVEYTVVTVDLISLIILCWHIGTGSRWTVCTEFLSRLLFWVCHNFLFLLTVGLGTIPKYEWFFFSIFSLKVRCLNHRSSFSFASSIPSPYNPFYSFLPEAEVFTLAK